MGNDALRLRLAELNRTRTRKRKRKNGKAGGKHLTMKKKAKVMKMIMNTCSYVTAGLRRARTMGKS